MILCEGGEGGIEICIFGAEIHLLWFCLGTADLGRVLTCKRVNIGTAFGNVGSGQNQSEVEVEESESPKLP